MITLSIDADALKLLFPIGSEARVELSKAAIAAYADRTFLMSGAAKQDLQAVLNGHLETLAKAKKKLLEDAKQEAEADAGLTRNNHWGGYSLSPVTLKAVQDCAKAGVTEAWQATYKEAFNKRLAEIAADPKWDDYINERVRTQLNAVVLTRIREQLDKLSS